MITLPRRYLTPAHVVVARRLIRDYNNLMTTNATTLVATFPIKGMPSRLRLKCATCGRSQKADKGQILHLDTCATKEQPDLAIVVEHSDDVLRAFAADVRRAGMTGGRDALAAECVRKGFLSESDAMNTDD